MMRLSPTLVLASLALGGLLAHGCATVKSSVMVPRKISAQESLGGTVRIDATGTGRQAFVGRPLIEDEALYSAVRESILRSGVFDEVVEPASAATADRLLIVTVERLQEPGLDVHSTAEVDLRWRLMTPDRGRTIWEQVTRSRETVTSYEEFDSSKRARRAIESAMRDGLRRGVERLAGAPKT